MIFLVLLLFEEVILTIKIGLFIILSITIVFVSHKSLIRIQSHGFYRFFAFELILILFLLNIIYWFVSPFSFYQIISWIFLFISTYFVIEGYGMPRIKGNADDLRPGEELYKLEKTTKLIKEGIYKFIRHPLYSSLLFLSWGIFLKSVSMLGFILIIIISFFLMKTAKIEEKENSDYFGYEYENYMQKSKMFIPYIW